MVDYLMINPQMAGIAGGIIGAIIIFLTTITGVLGYSKAAKWLEDSVWKKYGYRVSWGGAIWGAILGFIYGFLIWWIFSLIYNALI
jgi:uncharacterized protein YacL